MRAAATLAAVLVISLSPSPALPGEDEVIGRALFRRAWVPAPTVTRANDGLGPYFDARSCVACHPGGDRPALSPTPTGELPRGMVVRLTRPDGSIDPVHGRQVQAEAVTGLAPEASLKLVAESGRLRRFTVAISDLTDGPLAPDTLVSLRLAPALFGAGAVEAVPEADIRALADPEDRDGDGISGRVSEVRDRDGQIRLGRWGFQASAADLADQTAAAFSADLGLSTRAFPNPYGDCTPAQTLCRSAPVGVHNAAAETEIDDAIVTRIAAFLKRLDTAEDSPAPPPSPSGAAVYARLGCPACHAPLVGDARVIHSDLLLHDLGPGLAAGDPSTVSGREWRTTPLIGLGRRLAKKLPLLHDGRARTLDEAVKWHGGEASTAAKRYAALSATDRRALTDHLATFGTSLRATAGTP